MAIGVSSFKCSDCFLPAGKCKCPTGVAKIGVAPQELGRIVPIKAYQTTDGKKFVGERAREDAEDHQRWLDNQPKTKEPEPRKTLLKKRKKKRRKRT